MMQSSSKRKAEEAVDSTSTTKRKRIEDLIQKTNQELEAQIASDEAQVAALKQKKKQITDILGTILGDGDDRMDHEKIGPGQRVADAPRSSHTATEAESSTISAPTSAPNALKKPRAKVSGVLRNYSLIDLSKLGDT